MSAVSAFKLVDEVERNLDLDELRAEHSRGQVFAPRAHSGGVAALIR